MDDCDIFNINWDIDEDEILQTEAKVLQRRLNEEANAQERAAEAAKLWQRQQWAREVESMKRRVADASYLLREMSYRRKGRETWSDDDMIEACEATLSVQHACEAAMARLETAGRTGDAMQVKAQLDLLLRSFNDRLPRWWTSGISHQGLWPRGMLWRDWTEIKESLETLLETQHRLLRSKLGCSCKALARSEWDGYPIKRLMVEIALQST